MAIEVVSLDDQRFAREVRGLTGLLIRNAVIDDRRCDVRCRNAVVSDMGDALPSARGEEVVDARGGALLPGLHDHHLHLLSMAAARGSLSVAPPARGGLRSIERALAHRDAQLPPGEWIRCIGYDDSVAGPLDRRSLDKVVPTRPVRVQHRSGAMWVLNSAALALAAVDDDAPAGVERAADGTPTGRFYGLDAWLRGRIGARAPDLSPVIEELNSYGVTGVTDASPSAEATDVEPLVNDATARTRMRIVVMCGSSITARNIGGLSLGPVKIVLEDHALPSIDDLVANFRVARSVGRPVAVHSVTLESLVLALAAWQDAGAARGDRLEHGAVVPPAQAAELAAHGITVITQPSFVEERGDAYLDGVDPEDLPFLYPCRSLLEAGVEVGFSTDAPFGHPDPWRAVAAAGTRKTRSGRTLGAAERIHVGDALMRFLTPPESPGGLERRVSVGSSADLCLLRCPLREALAAPSSEVVQSTVVRGRVVWSRS